MGIHGLWEELSSAVERIALAKLAADKWERENGRCLRVAIDTSIWAFQVQSGKEGSNPALRTFYYRLCRLLHSNVEPLFIFDGPQKPPFKRNQKTAFLGQTFETTQLKALINAFGFMSWDAPGEAEAECALFEKLGVVDIVITEDVDCLMFGAKRVGREVKNKSRSHVDLYSNVEEVTGLNKDGLVLVAMMSGGDYLPAGVTSCGPKIAVEIARAGFGTSLMRTDDYQSWREELTTELSTNSENKFTRRQPALAKRILESTFPDPTILSYYCHPVVSSEERVSAFVPQWRKPDIPVLAKLCRRLFEWDSRWGMVRFMRSITPGLLLYTIIHRNTNTSATDESPPRRKSTGKLTDYFKSTKSSIVKKNPHFIAIHGTRKHTSTDTLEELRLSYIPSNLQSYLTLNFDLTQYSHPTPPSPGKRPKESSDSKDTSDEELEGFSWREAKWSPDEVQRIWIPKVYVETCYPKEFSDWERSEVIRRSPKKGKKVAQIGAMDQFVRREPDIRTIEIGGAMEGKSSASSTRKSPVRKGVERKENVKSPTRTIRKENIISPSIMTRRKENILSSAKKVNPSTTRISNVVTPTKQSPFTSSVTWKIPSDSDSDSLPSPTNMLSYTPKTSRTQKTIEDGSPMKVSGNVLGSFRESFGGTLYEIDDA